MTREQWKERLPLIEAFANGKRVERLSFDEDKWIEPDDIMFTAKTDNYRIVEPPKYREWTMDDAPVNCMVRLKGETEWVSCIGACKYGMRLPWSAPTWSALLENYEHSIDGGNTWLPCGVEVK